MVAMFLFGFILGMVVLAGTALGVAVLMVKGKEGLFERKTPYKPVYSNYSDYTRTSNSQST